MPPFLERGPWRARDFRRLWTAMVVSAVGSRVTRTALPVIAVSALSASPGWAALIGALSWGPGAVVGLVAGGWVDRRSKRALLIGADLVRAVLVLSVPLAWWAGALSLIHVGLVAAGVGAASALFQITDNTLLPELVPREDLIAANSTLEATESAAEVGGPAVAGLLIRAVGAPLAVLLDALSYLWSAAVLATIPPRPRGAPAPSAAVLDDLRLGVRALAADPLLRVMAAAECLSLISMGFFLGLYMLFVLRDLALSEATVGLIISCGGIGALAGALLAPRLARRAPRAPLFTLMLTHQLAALLIPAARGAPVVIVSLLVVHQQLGDAARTAYDVLGVSLRQQRLPAELLGRANGAYHAWTTAALLAGSLISGAVAEAFGTREALWVGLAAGLAAPFSLLLGLAGPASNPPGGPSSGSSGSG